MRQVAICGAWLMAIVGGQLLCAQQTGLVPEKTAKIDQAARAAMSRDGIPGLSVAIGRAQGKGPMTLVFGTADLEHGVPVKPTTRFRTASIAKPMTAVAAMQLVQEKKLELSADIRKWVAGFPEKRWPVTLAHLLSHQGGVRHYARPGEAAGKRSYTSLEESLSLFAADPLKFEPGTQFLYTTYGYSLVGRAVEVASKSTFEDYLRNHVWQPAGMKQTTVDHHFEVISGRMRGYMRVTRGNRSQLPESLRERVKIGQIVRAQLHDTSMKVPGGGLLSTAGDLVRFGTAMLEDRLVSRETREAMWSVRRTADDKETGYGLGWSISNGKNGLEIGHGGGQAGTTCMLVIRPGKGIVVAVMSNLRGAREVKKLARCVANIAAE